MIVPTVAEEHYAKVIAIWHGSHMIVDNKTTACLHGYGSWGDSPERYMRAHWREYLGAAKAMIEQRGQS